MSPSQRVPFEFNMKPALQTHTPYKHVPHGESHSAEICVCVQVAYSEQEREERGEGGRDSLLA